MLTREKFRKMPLHERCRIYFAETKCKYFWQVQWCNNWRRALARFTLSLPHGKNAN